MNKTFLFAMLLLLYVSSGMAAEFLSTGSKGQYYFRCEAYRSGKITVTFSNGNVVVKGTPTRSYYIGNTPADRKQRRVFAYKYARQYCLDLANR